FYNLLVGILILGFSFYLFNGVKLPEDIFYLGAAYVGLSLGLMLHGNLLTFLTVKNVFITRFITMFIVVGLVMTLFDLVMPGFVVTGFEINGLSSGLISIQQYTADKYATIALISVMAAMIASLLEDLRNE